MIKSVKSYAVVELRSVLLYLLCRRLPWKNVIFDVSMLCRMRMAVLLIFPGPILSGASSLIRKCGGIGRKPPWSASFIIVKMNLYVSRTFV